MNPYQEYLQKRADEAKVQKVDGRESVVIPKKEFLEEHHRLLGVLKSRDRKDDRAEYRDQAHELAQVEKGAGRALPEGDLASIWAQQFIDLMGHNKQAATVFLGGKVSGPDGDWREDVKDELREKGHKPIDPKVPAKEWKPETHIYKELKQILTADKVVFHKGGFFTRKEKEICDAVGKPYTVIKKPEDALKVVKRAAFSFPVKKEALGTLRRLDNAFGRTVSDSVVSRAFELAQSRGEEKATLRDILQARHMFAGEHLAKRAAEEAEETNAQRFGHGALHVGLAAGATHVGLNAALMAKDKFLPQSAQASMQAAMTHALHGRELRPSVHEGLGLLAGFETVGTEYDAAHKLTNRALNSRFAKGDPERAARLMKRFANTKAVGYAAERNHVVDNMRKAVQNLDMGAVKDYKPNNLLTIESAKIDPQKAQWARRAVNVGSVAAGFAINPDLALGPMINKSRQVIGSTAQGQQMVKNMMAKGVTDGKMHQGKKLLTSLLASPAVGQIQDVGAMVGDAVRDRLPAAHAAHVNKGIASVVRGSATPGQAVKTVAKDILQPGVDKVKTVAQPGVDKVKNIVNTVKGLAKMASDEPFNPYRSYMDKVAANKLEGMLEHLSPESWNRIAGAAHLKDPHYLNYVNEHRAFKQKLRDGLNPNAHANRLARVLVNENPSPYIPESRPSLLQAERQPALV